MCFTSLWKYSRINQMTARWRQINWSRLPFAASLGRRDLERLDSPQIRPPSRSDSWHKMDSKCHYKGLFWFFFSFCLFVFLFGYWFLFYILWLLHHWSRSCNSVAAASSGKFDVANFQISPPSRSTCLLDLCVCVLQGEWGGRLSAAGREPSWQAVRVELDVVVLN